MSEITQSEADVKLTWEIRKLEAEVEALRRPFKNPSVIAALTTATLVAIVSCGGLLIQLFRSDREYTLAQIKAERLKLESEKLQGERAALDAEISARRHELQKVQHDLKKVDAALASAAGNYAQLQDVLRRLREATDALTGTSTPSPGAAVSIGISPGTIKRGESAQLDWSSSNAASVTIEPGIGNVGASGRIAVSPASTTTYVIVGISKSGEPARARATVVVVEPPVPARSDRDPPYESRSRH